MLKKQSDVDGNVGCEDRCMAQTRKKWYLAEKSTSYNPRYPIR
jgi:hypothetical protein